MSSANPPQGPAQHEQAARFFDEVSGTYKDKYKDRSPFHRYFFNERLEKATRGFDLSDADVLDIGSGTGDLYEHLVARFPRMRFHATDVSAGMLAQSPVPAERKYVGHAYEHSFPVKRFDAVFMLGVTTYLTPEELEKNLAFIADSLKPGGHAIITFTNAHALDSWTRNLARGPMSWFARKGNVLSSGLKLWMYGCGDVQRIMGRHFRIERLDVLNHTVFPFNLLLQGLSLRLARRLSRLEAMPAWLRWLSSDLLVRVSKKV
ncbi:MAG: class I SAM-dependent methyltransferase [Flavobacteriales bacterium]|nr:class I SAM-dependent methyltransferase [Flavobacteriales bacterium]